MVLFKGIVNISTKSFLWAPKQILQKHWKTDQIENWEGILKNLKRMTSELMV